jgi:hypothetical protein
MPTKRPRFYVTLTDEMEAAIRAAKQHSTFPLATSTILQTFILAGIKAMNAKPPHKQ